MDVIVNSTSSELDLTRGTVSNALLKVGGQQLQDECRKMKPKGICDGELIETSSGNLQCKSVYHTSLSPFKEASAVQVI